MTVTIVCTDKGIWAAAVALIILAYKKEDENNMPRATKLEKIARQLHEYMEFRAKDEGTGYDLNEAFFIGGIKAGIPNFFGISFDTNRLTGDFQNPDAFAKWQARQNKDNEPND